jgi:hypothetical protein
MRAFFIRTAQLWSPPMPLTEIFVDLEGLPDSVIDAIQMRAEERGIPFERAMTQMLAEYSRELQKIPVPSRPNWFGRLLGNRPVH